MQNDLSWGIIQTHGRNMMERVRPLGVTIVAILMIIGGIILLGTGVFGLIAGIGLSALGLGEMGAFVTAIIVVSIIVIALGIASLIVSWGLIKAKSWAWKITVILSIIIVITSIVSIATGNPIQIIHLIVYGVILYYMYRPDVRTYFGKVKVPK